MQMRAFRSLQSVSRQIRIAETRLFATSARSAGSFSAADIGKMAVNGIRPSEVKVEKTYSSLPKVEEYLVRVTLVDFKGDQYNIVGRVGDSLMQAAARYGNAVPLEDDSGGGGVTHQYRRSHRWIEDAYGEGPSSWSSHVVIPKEWFEKLPEPMYAEIEMLNLIDEEDRTPNSRLATEITLTKDLDGLTVYVPDPPPNDDVVQSYTL